MKQEFAPCPGLSRQADLEFMVPEVVPGTQDTLDGKQDTSGDFHDGTLLDGRRVSFLR
jgi:hypothetical protein